MHVNYTLPWGTTQNGLENNEKQNWIPFNEHFERAAPPNICYLFILVFIMYWSHLWIIQAILRSISFCCCFFVVVICFKPERLYAKIFLKIKTRNWKYGCKTSNGISFWCLFKSVWAIWSNDFEIVLPFRFYSIYFIQSMRLTVKPKKMQYYSYANNVFDRHVRNI